MTTDQARDVLSQVKTIFSEYIDVPFEIAIIADNGVASYSTLNQIGRLALLNLRAKQALTYEAGKCGFDLELGEDRVADSDDPGGD